MPARLALAPALPQQPVMSQLFSPLLRALDQLGDVVFLGVVLRSVIWSAICFIVLFTVTLWGLQPLLHLHGTLAWAADILGTAGTLLLAFWLFLPVAAVIGTFYIERIARAVERRYYPTLSPARGAPLGAQIADGLSLGLRILLLELVGLILALIPGIGILLGWLIAAYAIGRGLFMAVAMRRMPRPAAIALYRGSRGTILLQGGIIALAAYIPLLNLLIPVIGTAVMVHVLDRALSTASEAA